MTWGRPKARRSGTRGPSERTLAASFGTARARGFSGFRVAHSIRRRQAAAAGARKARARRRSGPASSRARFCGAPAEPGIASRSPYCCGQRAFARWRLCLRHSNWRGGRRYPLVPPQRAASRATLGSYSSLRPFGCGPPLSAGLPVRSCRPPRHSGAGCGGF
jgi:hypothetical protein